MSSCAKAYELEAKNHSSFIKFYSELAEQRRRPEIRFGQGYQDAPFFTNDYGGRLTAPRQDEWWPYDTRPHDPDPERDEANLRALAVREQNRSAYFARLGAKYRRAATLSLAPGQARSAPPEWSGSVHGDAVVVWALLTSLEPKS